MKQKHLIQKPRPYIKLNRQSRHKESGERGVCVDQCRRRCQVENSEYSPSFKQADTHAVAMVSWEDAQGLYAWLTKKELAAGKITSGQQCRFLAVKDPKSAGVGAAEVSIMKSVHRQSEGLPPSLNSIYTRAGEA